MSEPNNQTPEKNIYRDRYHYLGEWWVPQSVAESQERRIAELTKERDEWKESGTAYARELGEAHLQLSKYRHVPLSGDISQPPLPPNGNQLAWLVELKASNPQKYRTISEAHGIYWTADPNEALRFCRREDAERFSEGDADDVRIVEHMWCASPPAAPTTPGDEVRNERSPSQNACVAVRSAYSLDDVKVSSSLHHAWLVGEQLRSTETETANGWHPTHKVRPSKITCGAFVCDKCGWTDISDNAERMAAPCKSLETRGSHA